MTRAVLVLPTGPPGGYGRPSGRGRVVAALLGSLAMVGCEAKVFDHILPERNRRPIAAFTIKSKEPSGSRELVVTFDASASVDDSEIRDYIWDFGDASAVQTLQGDAGRFPKHSYLVANNAVTVKLLVRDDDGEVSEPVSARLLLSLNHPPAAAFTPTDVAGDAPLVVIFNASSSSDPDPNETDLLEYRWQFEDGAATESTRNPVIQHRYAARGTFTVTLKVFDGLDESTPVYGQVRVQ